MNKHKSFQKQQYVEWDWGNGTASGQIQERLERDVIRTLNGSEITRKGSEENPAYLIEQEDGTQVLKLGSELHAATD